MFTNPHVLTIAMSVLFLNSTLLAQVTPPDAELEGPLLTVDQATGELSVMGIKVVINGNTKIESPSAVLTLDQLKDTTPLPGRTEEGFKGGTATVTGTVDPMTGVVTAATLHVEPAENVVLGVITENVAGKVKVNGLQVEYLNDARMPLKAIQNEFGFAVKPESILVGTPGSIEGYYDGTLFRAFLLEIDGQAEMVDPNPQVSILRAQTRDREDGKRDEVKARGAVTMKHAADNVTTQTVALYRVDNGVDAFLDVVEAERAEDNPEFAIWTYSGKTPPSSHPIYSHAPGTIKAVNLSEGAGLAFKILEAEVRVD